MAVDTGLIGTLRDRLAVPALIREQPFSVVRDLSVAFNSDISAIVRQDLVLRALENRDSFGKWSITLDGFVRNLGLYPYLRSEELDRSDQIAYEFHRPLNLDESTVFHGPQAKVYRLLLDGHSVALSAPTSFGKSLVIDAIIASRKYNNVAIIVPTIALIDETRRRLTRRFQGEFKVITHSSQSLEKKNIFVLTQERLLEFEQIEIDFFVIDEFYKLSPGRDDDDRCWLLNQAFYKLAKSGKQFYMLGPGIEGLSQDLLKRMSTLVFLKEDFHTVASDVTRIESRKDILGGFAALCRNLIEPTLVFCSSPRRATEAAKVLIDLGIGEPSTELNDASEWISDNYHPQWHFPVALRNGIGIHHGRIPRALGQYVVRQFNDGRLRFLVCTSTLIEGVNTKAKNIVVLDNTVARKEIDLFTFNNIQGRAGRMFQHFVGRVFIFYDPPQTDLPFVDVPAYSQDAPASLLIQLEESELNDKAKSKLAKYREQDLLSYATLRKNIGVDLDSQLSLAETISASLEEMNPLLRWTQYPTYAQLSLACKLIWDHFGGVTLGARSAWNDKQLAFLINMLRPAPSARELILGQIKYERDRGSETSPDEIVQRVLDFLRLWANYHFPRLLRALSNIQEDIFSRRGLPVGNYELMASNVENRFLDPALVALDEYGIPFELARKLSSVIDANGSLDAALAKLKFIKVQDLELKPFERELITDAQLYL